MPHVVFETPRLLVRRLRPADATPLLEVYGDADAMRWVGDGEPLDAAQCARWLVVTEENYRLRGYGMFAVVERASAAVIGFCGLVHPGGQSDAEVKYAFRRSAWGHGFASEAVAALLEHGRSVHALPEIIATVAPGNRASQRVLAKSGMASAEVRANADGTRTLVFRWRGTDRAASAITVRRALVSDLDELVALFDHYRQFQGRESDPAAARAFLQARFAHGDAVAFIARTADAAVGFAQLYPSHSSVALAPVFILNDLFVQESARRAGVASGLLAAVEAHAWSVGAARVTLNVARDNARGQALYDARGWVRDTQFFMYHRYPDA